MDRIIINIGRQFGSGGKTVAKLLSERLGIPVYDNELIAEAARKSGFSKELFRKSDEKKRWLSLSNVFHTGTFNSFNGSGIADIDLFRIQSETILQLASEGSAIFVGRASDYVLREMDCLDVFICAPTDVRKKLVAEREGISEEEALQLIARRDRGRAAYYNYMTLGDWGVASNYDLCIDSSVLGFEGTADTIIEFARKKGWEI